MQMRCKLPNEFAIRRPRLSCPGSACEFYEWACVGGGAARRPAPTFPCAAPATCRAARCCFQARCQPVSCFGWGEGGCGQSHAASRQHVARTTRPLGPSRGSILWRPCLGPWNEFLKQEGLKLAFRPCFL